MYASAVAVHRPNKMNMLAFHVLNSLNYLFFCLENLNFAADAKGCLSLASFQGLTASLADGNQGGDNKDYN